MFGFLSSQEQKMRANAANWLELAAKVLALRSDRMKDTERSELEARQEDLRRLLGERADAGKLKLAIESLEGVLARTGGAVYPRTSLVENVEFFLVAAIVILGLRAYFVQPFKIPTNSMWPTYYGMTGENLPPGTPPPGPLKEAVRFLALGARRCEIDAPQDGEVSVPFTENSLLAGYPRVAYTTGTRRSWLFFSEPVHVYTVYVGGVPATVSVPADFSDFDSMLLQPYFPKQGDFGAQYRKSLDSGVIEDEVQRSDEGGERFPRIRRVPLGRFVKAGDPVVRFDLLTGDQLFVDRITYNFMRPKVGQGFVFHTEGINIPDGDGEDQYFIKRLVGTPGDRIEIRQPVLYRNGAPITGSKAFQLNADRVPPYRGYFNATHDDLRFALGFPGEPITVPPQSFLAMGDNSGNSLDGRYWGYVPARNVVGRPIFIYYPFTKRWLTAK